MIIMDSIFDEIDLCVLGAAIITAALVSARVSTTNDSAVETFKTIASGIARWIDEDTQNV